MVMQEQKQTNESPSAEATGRMERFETWYADFLSATEALQALIEVENECLKTGKRKGIDAKDDRKEELCEVLRGLLTNLIGAGQFLEGRQMGKCERMVEQVKGIQRLLGENRLLLNAAKVSTYRRIEAAVEARRQETLSSRRYDDTGGADRGQTNMPMKPMFRSKT